MKKSAAPAFSTQTLEFLKKAQRTKSTTWLEKNRTEYEKLVLHPLKHLAESLKKDLMLEARDYHFPQKGIGRLKRPAHRAAEYGSLYKDYISYSASRPAESRFDHNPNLFFLIYPRDKDDPVLLAGGLYVPSSRQVRAIREAIATDASAFEKLFASKEFTRLFGKGFSNEKISSRPPRGFDPNHPRMNWLRLQAFFVWRPYTVREFTSRDFSKLVSRDCKQILRLNELLDKALQGRLPSVTKTKAVKSSGLLARLEDITPVRREMDF